MKPDHLIKSGPVKGEVFTLSGDAPNVIIEMTYDLMRHYSLSEDELINFDVKFEEWNSAYCDKCHKIRFVKANNKNKGSLPYYLKRSLRALGFDKLPNQNAGYASQP